MQYMGWTVPRLKSFSTNARLHCRGLCFHLHAVPLARVDLEVVLVFCRRAKVSLKERLRSQKFDNFRSQLCQVLRRASDYSNNGSFLREQFLVLNRQLYDRGERPFLLQPRLEISRVLARLR